MTGRSTQKPTCGQPIKGRAMPENEIPPAMRVDFYLIQKNRENLVAMGKVSI